MPTREGKKQDIQSRKPANEQKPVKDELTEGRLDEVTGGSFEIKDYSFGSS